MAPYGFIYITTNLLNGKRYLGMCAYHRNNHNTYLGSGKALRRAVKKYGTESFFRETIEECATKDDMIAAEIRYIKEFNCVEDKSWYNITNGGYATRGFAGKTHSEETKAKIRQNYKRPMTEKTRELFKENGKQRAFKLREYQKENPDYLNKKLIFDGVFYPSIGDCVKSTGLTRNTINRRIKHPPRSVTVYGMKYETVNHAAKALGVSHRYINRRLLDPSNTDVILHQSEYRFL